MADVLIALLVLENIREVPHEFSISKSPFADLRGTPSLSLGEKISCMKFGGLPRDEDARLRLRCKTTVGTDLGLLQLPVFF